MADATPSREYVLVGKLIRTQGRHGELLAEILTDFPDRFKDRPQVWLLPPGDGVLLPREAVIERSWLHKGRMVLKLAGIDSMNDAEALRGWDVAVLREQRMPLQEDAVYIDDLIGCRVFDDAAAGVDLGLVRNVARGENGSADLLVVTQHEAHRDSGTKSGSNELLIPFVKSYIVSLDLDGRCLHMRLPAGLTALNAPPTEEERSALQQSQDE